MKTFRTLLCGETRTPQDARTVLLSLLVACSILLGGMLCTWRLGGEANTLHHQLDHAQEGLAALRLYAQTKKAGAP